ncbi:hypothetical protein ABTX82_26305 [Streptomyces lavendulae]|uniref:hypothetical protein n=2 Tax=Streptomyces lavendulae TaxID=1914 RepID=UPI0024A2CAB1|nr:hypothetical protein [Streptomyces lavendulae]GLV97337.1 hypothetical protein Slala05_09690 [Streptomyces lavendulae subsp. lavendulae]
MDMQTWRDGWVRATDAAEAVRTALAALGVPEGEWCGLRPLVTKTGGPLVDLGTVRAEAAERLAEALRAVMATDVDTYP